MVAWLKYPHYTIDGWNANALDDFGAEWYVESSDIRDGVAPKTHYEERPTGPGAWWSRSYQSGKPIVVSGYGRAADLAGRERARLQLLGLFVDGGLHTLTYDSGDSVRTAKVGLNGTPRFAVRRNKTSFGWQLPLFNPDGVMYGATPRTTAAVQSSSLATDGLDWETGGGLDWDEGGQGLDWGTSGSGGFLSLDNAGNVEAWPVFTLAGPLIQPVLTDPVTGRQLYYSGALSVGQTLVIDTSPQNRSVKLDGVDRFGFMLSAQWMSIPPGGQLLLQFGGSGVGTAMATWQEVYT
jgi:hypothetical protein